MQIAGEVRGFDELAWVDKQERKHVSRVLPLALAAATEALQGAGIDLRTLRWKNGGGLEWCLGRVAGRRSLPRNSTGCFFISSTNP